FRKRSQQYKTADWLAADQRGSSLELFLQTRFGAAPGEGARHGTDVDQTVVLLCDSFISANP
ncbi:hypothetical protein BaRGS_00039641, partial [Batillaria attramentaria]